MTVQLAFVSRERHATKKWQRFNGYGFAANLSIAPIVAAELSQAVHGMPLAFAKEGDRYFLAAVLSLIPGRNLFVGPNGQWLGAYVPAALRSFPFRLVQKQDSQETMLAVDEGSGLIVDAAAEGELFFDAGATPSAAVISVMEFLKHIHASRNITDRAVAALAEAEVIQPWPLKIGTEQGEQDVTGLYRVDEQRIQALSDDAFAKLRQGTALPVAYGQLFSMGQINLFPQLGRLQAQLAPKTATPMDLLQNLGSVDPIFELSTNTDTIKFE